MHSAPEKAVANRRLWVAHWICLALLLSGCVGVLPVPPLSSRVLERRAIRRSEAALIVPGRTTRAQVETILGPVTRECRYSPSVAYSWERQSMDVYVWIVSTTAADGLSFDVGGWQAFFVAFDDQGVVLRREFVRLSNNRSLDDQLERWARRVRERAKLKPL